MPKLIDHATRATVITEAAWTVLVRDGLGAVSVRNVAAEAGLATASLRRAFPTQAALLAACMTLLNERVEARIRALPPSPDPVDSSLAALLQVMPLDAQRRTEMHVYLELATAALTDADLAQTYRRMESDIEHLCRLIIAGLGVPESSEPAHRQAVTHLHALIDGLALHLLHGLDPDLALQTLREHLERVRSQVPSG